MRIIFDAGRRQTIWSLPMFKKEDEDAIMDWAEKHKVNAEGINSVAQLARLVDGILGSQSRRR